MQKPLRPSPFEHGSVTEFLNSYESWALAHLPGYSRRNLAKWSKISSPNFFTLLISGKRRLTKTWLAGLERGLKLETQEKTALAYLAQIQTAKSYAETLQSQSQFFELWQKQPLSHIQQAQGALLTDRLALTLYHMIDLEGQDGSASWFRSRLREAVNLQQIRQSLQLLLKLKMIRRQKNGAFESLEKQLQSPDQLKQLENYLHHKNCLAEAARALETLSSEERFFGSFCASVDRSNAEAIKQEISNFGQYLAKRYSSKNKVKGNVVRLNLQFYPVTKEDSKK